MRRQQQSNALAPAWVRLALGGSGTRMDIQELQSKAGAGSVVAQGVLGIAYLYGHDVPKD